MSKNMRKTKKIALMGLFAALSIVFGRLFAFTVGPFRLSFENLPVILAGVTLGPVAGCFVGICEDLVGCMISGYAVNPVITVGAACVGAVSGLIYNKSGVENENIRLGMAVGLAHLTGSVILKSAGLYLYYNYSPAILIWRVPTYVLIAAAEFCVSRLILGNKALLAQIERL